MKALNNNKGLILFALVVFGGAFVYKSFFASPVDTTSTDVTSGGPGAEVVALYQSLESVTLDTSVLTSPAYKALMDFTTPLAPQPVGRSNPFDKI